MNKPLHVRDIHAEGDGVYIPPPEEHTPKFLVVQTSMLQDVLGNNYIPEENAS
jgi:hypothetical protein